MYGGVMIGYPAYHGLGEWEPCRVIFEDKTDILKKDEPVVICFLYVKKLKDWKKDILHHVIMKK